MKAQTSEELIRSLRELEGEEQEDALTDARWERLAAGTASDEDRAALERLAHEDPLAREALALFAPLGEDAQRRYAGAIEAELAASREQAKAPAAGPIPEPAREHTREHTTVVPLRARPPRGASFRRLAAAGTALAMAAAVALMLTRPHAPGATLPAYALALSGGEAIDRGEPDATLPVLRRGSRLTLTLRPATPVRGPVEARAFLVQAGRTVALDAALQLSADGAVRLVARVAEVSPGDAEIVAVIARPGALGPGVEALAPGEGRQVIRQKARAEGAP